MKRLPSLLNEGNHILIPISAEAFFSSLCWQTPVAAWTLALSTSCTHRTLRHSRSRGIRIL